MRYFESEISYRLNLSRTLSMLVSENIERRFKNFSLDPSLKMEIILLDSRTDGETPSEKEKP